MAPFVEAALEQARPASLGHALTRTRALQSRFTGYGHGLVGPRVLGRRRLAASLQDASPWFELSPSTGTQRRR